MTAADASEPEVPREPIEVWVTVPAAPPVRGAPGGFDDKGEVETQSKLGDWWRGVTTADPDEFLESWRKAFRAVEAVFATDAGPASGSSFQLESVTAKLTLKASGKVVFVGEAGGEVSFEACFSRRDPATLQVSPRP